jgi:hypothetical protein
MLLGQMIDEIVQRIVSFTTIIPDAYRNVVVVIVVVIVRIIRVFVLWGSRRIRETSLFAVPRLAVVKVVDITRSI